MAIELNKVVTLNFTLSDETGNVLDSSDQGGPFSYISGSGMVLPKLEEAVNGMIIGTKKQLKLDAKDGYGEYNEDAIQAVGGQRWGAVRRLWRRLGAARRHAAGGGIAQENRRRAATGPGLPLHAQCRRRRQLGRGGAHCRLAEAL